MTMEMKYDKVNDYVAFIDSTHTYFNLKDPEVKYTSVTTLISKYHEEFDEDFWSSYKAIEKIMGDEFVSLGVKKTLLDLKKIPNNLVSDLGINKDEFDTIKKSILESYETNRVQACERGSKIHKIKEELFYENNYHTIEKLINKKDKFYCKQNDFNLEIEQAIYPEFLVYYHHRNGYFNIAGQVDLLIKDGNDIYIYDYKTNAKGIEDKPFFDRKTKKNKKMFHPISDLDDTVLMHYTLQLSLYAYMLQEINPDFVIRSLKLIHIDKDMKEKEITLDYKKDEIKKLIDYHAKRVKKETLNKNITFDFLNDEW